MGAEKCRSAEIQALALAITVLTSILVGCSSSSAGGSGLDGAVQRDGQAGDAGSDTSTDTSVADTGSSDTGVGADTGTDTSSTDGGDAGPTTSVQCMDGADAVSNPPDERITVDGEGGPLTDQCDEDGNLTQALCETRTECTDPPNPACITEQTGTVVTETVDCDGRCVEGACASRCPDTGDTFTYVSIETNGDARFDSAQDERGIVCQLGFDQPSDGFDCVTDPDPGDEITIVGLGLRTGLCTGGVWGNVSTDACSYIDCTFVYD